MAEYRLKPGQESIRVTDGAFAGRLYRSGCIYAEIPPEEASRFEPVPAAKLKKPAKVTADNEVIE